VLKTRYLDHQVFASKVNVKRLQERDQGSDPQVKREESIRIRGTKADNKTVRERRIALAAEQS